MSAPLVRASYAKTVIGGIKRRPQEECAKLLNAIGGPLRAEVRGYGMLDWMPGEHFVQMVTVIHGTVGASAAKDFWRANLLLSLERRLLTPLRLGAIAVYGNSPRSLLKMTPEAWQLVTRDGGVCHTDEDSPAAIRLSFTQLPPIFCTPAMQMLWAGGSESCIERMGFRGAAMADGSQVHKGCVTIHVRWDTP